MVFVCGAAARGIGAETTPRPASRPNIVIILADDLGFGDVSCYGAKKVHTPNVDRLAREGLRFTDAHATSATCTPSRYALLTGEYPWRKKGTGILPGDAALIIEPGRTTLPSLLRKAGYRTGVVGKWHLGLGGPDGPDWNADIKPGPLEIGFDYGFIMPATGDRTPCVYVENHRVVGLDPKDPIRVSYAAPVGEEPTGRDHPELLKMRPSRGHDQTIVNGISRIGYMSGGKAARWVDEDMADTFTRKATAFIEQNKDRPFFLYFATHDIHVPRVPHARFAGRSGMGPRGDVILQFDWCAGEILRTLDRLGLADNTLVILSSDNGPVVDDGYQDEAVEKLGDHKPAGPLRGGKYSIWEGGTRVPFVVRWPARIKAGTSDAVVCLMDCLASLAALSQQPLASTDALDSVNVLPALLGESKTGRKQLVEHAGQMLALREGLWKFIASVKGPIGQLYNLADDLAETNNLAAANPERVKELSEKLSAVRKGVNTQAGQILDAAGVAGGLVVHLNCGDGKLTAAMHADDSFAVHGLDADAANVAAARKHIQSRGLYGRVSVEQLSGKRLPYVDNLVNLVVAENLGGVPISEVLRVLVPNGVAYLKSGGQWTKTVKPWPQAIDEWTHYLHGPDNNAVARDTAIDIPRSIQWMSEPRWGRSHEELASLSAAVTAKGRIYYIVDEAPLASIRFLGDWKLVARDAFNGTLLWKRSISTWSDHLRHFRSGPVHLPRRLVAVGEKVYVTPGLDRAVLALDGATGNVLREYQGAERAEEIIVSDGVLYLAVGTSEAKRRGGGLLARGEPEPTDFRFITAIDADSAKPLWRKDFAREEFLLPLTLAVKSPRLYYQSSFGIVCLDCRSGKELWKTARPTPARRMAFSAPTLVATDEVVLLADRDAGKTAEDAPSTGTVEWAVHGWNEAGFARGGKSTLRAYSAVDGKELWSAACREGYNSPVDIFVIDGVVWVGTDFQGLDLKTGAPVKRINTTGPRVGMAHHRCYRDKASERFIFTGKSGIEVLSLDKGWLSNNSWIRGTCQYGILPANGLLYAPPNACACFLTVKVEGFFAAAPQRDKSGKMPFPEVPALEKGPLYGKLPSAAAPQGDEWPMYRHDTSRSGAASCAIPDAVHQQWCVSLGGRLTQPVVAGAKVFVASTDAHTLHALAAADGRELWRFTAGGRIDSSPTVYKSMVIFGSADGWVYCLGAADGALVWRFRAAPAERLVGVRGQLESIWPVHGAVLVQNDTIYATAGRSSYLDGGIVLYRIDPATGKELSKSVLYHLDPETGAQLVPEARFNMEGTTSDILSGDGDLVFLKYFTFDRSGNRIEATRPHLFSITSFLGEDWFVRSYWILGAGMPDAGWGGWANAAQAFPFGRILCFNKDAVYGYGREKVSGGATGHRAESYRLFGMERDARTPQTGKKGKKTAAAKPQPTWADTQSLIVRAMVLGADRLAVAGPRDLGKKDPDLLSFQNADEALASFEGKKGVYLRIVRAADGKNLSECELPDMPVFDGMAAANGRLYLATRRGQVICLSSQSY
jgi:arylsulfatase A-like enzyme/outer membrane protein assembly factor BamB